MTRFLFIRHGETDEVGVCLSGRGSKMSLNDLGRQQAEGLSQFLRPFNVDAVYSSPRIRAQETALFCVSGRNFRVQVMDELDEADFGSWTGRSFADLDSDPEWKLFNQFREFGAAPGGESTLQMQARVARALSCLRLRHPGKTVALVTHGDVIRVSLLLALGAPLNLLERLEISPGSVSVVEMDVSWTRVTAVNHVPNVRGVSTV